MSNEAFKKFTEYLATIPPENRASVLARAELLADNQTAPEAFEAPIMTLGQYLDFELPVPPELVAPNILVRGGVSAFIARAGFGKTQFNLNRFLKFAAGRPMFDDLIGPDGKVIMAPNEPLKILIVENEGSAGMFQRQIKKMLSAGDYTLPSGTKVQYLTEEDRKLIKENILIWGDGGYSGMKLDDPNKLNEVKAGCEKWNPDLVFFDPLRSLWNGEENSSTEMNIVLDAMADLATDYDCGIVVPHHAKKGGLDNDDKMSLARGSTVLEGAVATMENWDKAKGGDYREWSLSKHRYLDGEPVLPVRCQWQSSDQWYKHVPYDDIEKGIFQLFIDNPDETMSVADIRMETDESDGKIRKVLKELEESGRVKKYRGTSSGSGSSGYTYRLVTTREDEGGSALDF